MPLEPDASPGRRPRVARAAGDAVARGSVLAPLEHAGGSSPGVNVADGTGRRTSSLFRWKQHELE